MNHPATLKSDVYSLGVVLFQLYTGGRCPVGDDIIMSSEAQKEAVLAMKRPGTQTYREPVTPNEVIVRRRLKKADYDRLCGIHPGLFKALVESGIITDDSGNKVVWRTWWGQTYPSEQILRWDREIVDNEKRLRRRLKKAGIDAGQVDRIVATIVLPRVPVNIEKMIMGMLQLVPGEGQGNGQNAGRISLDSAEKVFLD